MRRLTRLLVIVTVVCALAWGGAHVATARTDHPPAPTIHQVRQGETLWEIVEARYPDSDQDVRRLIQQVMAANDLSSAALAPGQRLELPVDIH